MTPERIKSTAIGLAAIALSCLVAFLMYRKILPAEVGMPMLVTLGSVKLVLRSPQETPFPKPKDEDAKPAP